MLRSDASSERGVAAKIADFGLSVKMDHTETHVSGMNQVRESMGKHGIVVCPSLVCITEYDVIILYH